MSNGKVLVDKLMMGVCKLTRILKLVVVVAVQMRFWCFGLGVRDKAISVLSQFCITVA